MVAHEEIIVVSVGGSIIVPDAIDTDFLKKFKSLILTNIDLGRRFIIITGGGKTARAYQEAGRSAAPLTSEDLDWLGIHATRLNAHLLRAIFSDCAHPVIVKDPHSVQGMEHKGSPITHPLVIAAGWKPGWSTDYDAVLIAKNVGASRLINLSNIEKVYTADPKKDPEAQPIDDIAWHDFRALLPEHWDPGLSAPFDPIAAKEAEISGIEVAVIGGNNLEAFQNYLERKPFVGTTIH